MEVVRKWKIFACGAKVVRNEKISPAVRKWLEVEIFTFGADMV